MDQEAQTGLSHSGSMHGCLEPPMKISLVYVQSWQILNPNRGQLIDDRLKRAVDVEKSLHRSIGDRTTNELAHSPQMSYRGLQAPQDAKGSWHAASVTATAPKSGQDYIRNLRELRDFLSPWKTTNAGY